MKSRCRVCKDPVSDISKRYCPVLGFICGECHSFLLHADKVLKRHGIQHVTIRPQKFAPKKTP
jgi:hypothetical protein